MLVVELLLLLRAGQLHLGGVDHDHVVARVERVQAVNVQTAEYFGGMDTVTVPYGTPLEVIFDKEGAYDYKTVFQQEMDGKIIVYK